MIEHRGKKPSFHDVRHLTIGSDEKDAIKSYKKDLKSRGGDWRKGFKALKKRYKKGEETASDEFTLSPYTDKHEPSARLHEGQVSGRDPLEQKTKPTTSEDIVIEEDDND